MDSNVKPVYTYQIKLGSSERGHGRYVYKIDPGMTIDNGFNDFSNQLEHLEKSLEKIKSEKFLLSP